LNAVALCASAHRERALHSLANQHVAEIKRIVWCVCDELGGDRDSFKGHGELSRSNKKKCQQNKREACKR
jgi:hypothetical protein